MDTAPATEKRARMVSVVIPLYNEEHTVAPLFERLARSLSRLDVPWEAIAVDDGSRDASFAKLAEVARADSRVTAIRFKVNFGQTAALAAGIERAKGDVIVTIDSDLENDPADIPRLLAKMDEGYDIVSGWRRDRWRGAYFTRRLPSELANRLISRLTGVRLHDYGCTLKAYRADVIKGISLYGDMHRFVPAYAVWQGGRIAEIAVSHAPRAHGKSNYGMGRVFLVLMDLLVVIFMHRYMTRPMHFFGAWGFASFALGIAAGVAALALRLLFALHLVQTPLPVFSALFVIVGIQLMLFGVISETLMRTYYESQGKRPYVIRETANG